MLVFVYHHDTRIMLEHLSSRASMIMNRRRKRRPEGKRRGEKEREKEKEGGEKMRETKKLRRMNKMEEKKKDASPGIEPRTFHVVGQSLEEVGHDAL